MTPIRWVWIALQLGDLLTTLCCFRLGGYEANPIVRGVFPMLGPIGGVCLAKLFAAGIVLRLRSSWILYAGVGVASLVVAWNTLVIAAALRLA
jgi:hypothetical protein